MKDDPTTADVDDIFNANLLVELMLGFLVLQLKQVQQTAATDADGSAGGRLSNVSLSGGFGTITLGQIWSASGNHYGGAIDPSHGSTVQAGGAGYRNGNSISYSSSAGDVSFQIDKVTGDKEKVEFGATADLGPVGVGLGYWNNGVANDDNHPLLELRFQQERLE